MRKIDKSHIIKKANILSENLYLENKFGYKLIPENLSNEHITNVLGINLPLNESRFISEELYNRIIAEQLLFENIFKQIADFAKDKADKAIATVKSWVDTAAVIVKLLKDNTGVLLKRFLVALKRRFEIALKPILDNLKKMGDVGLVFVKSIEKILSKIESLEPWKKLFAYMGIGAIALFITKKMSAEGGINQVIIMIKEYFSEKFFGDLIKTLAGWQTFMTFINTITGLANILWEFIGELVTGFGDAMKGDDWDKKTLLFKE